LNSHVYDAFITVLRDVALSRALSKNGVILLGHKEPMLRQLWYIVFHVVHCFRARNMVRQMSEQVPEYFCPDDLMNPYLRPGLSLHINIPEQIFGFVRVKREPGAAQRGSTSTEQETVYVRRAHCVGNESSDLICGKFNGVFVVHTPVDPFFVIDVCKQMQHGAFD